MPPGTTSLTFSPVWGWATSPLSKQALLLSEGPPPLFLEVLGCEGSVRKLMSRHCVRLFPVRQLFCWRISCSWELVSPGGSFKGTKLLGCCPDCPVGTFFILSQSLLGHTFLDEKVLYSAHNIFTEPLKPQTIGFGNSEKVNYQSSHGEGAKPGEIASMQVPEKCW